MNNQTNCYQGILVTLGNMMIKNQLDDIEFREVKALFENLNVILPTPDGF